MASDNKLTDKSPKQEIILKRAADLAEALYSMPRNTPSQLTGLPAPRSPASALNNAAAAAMSAGFNAAYAATAGQLSGANDQNLYHQSPQTNACIDRMNAYNTTHKPMPSHVYCYVYNGIRHWFLPTIAIIRIAFYAFFLVLVSLHWNRSIDWELTLDSKPLSIDYNRTQSSSVSPSRGYGSNASTPHSSSGGSSYGGNGTTATMNGGYGSPPTNMTPAVPGSPGLFNGQYSCVWIAKRSVLTDCVPHWWTGMSSIVSASPFATMNPFALPTCNGQSYGSSIVSSTKWSNNGINFRTRFAYIWRDEQLFYWRT